MASSVTTNLDFCMWIEYRQLSPKFSEKIDLLTHLKKGKRACRLIYSVFYQISALHGQYNSMCSAKIKKQ